MDDQRYPGYFKLGHGQPTATSLAVALFEAVNNIAEVLSGGGTLACDARTAVFAQRLCVELRDRARQVRLDSGV